MIQLITKRATSRAILSQTFEARAVLIKQEDKIMILTIPINIMSKHVYLKILQGKMDKHIVIKVLKNYTIRNYYTKK